MSKDQRYFNFPIQLLNGYLANSKKVLNDISDYATYVQANSYHEKNGFEWVEHSEIENAVGLSDAYFGIITTNKIKCYENGELLYNSIPTTSPMVGINIGMYFEYKNEKTEFEKVCLLGFLSIKSILQNKAYCKIDNNFWLSRMDGKAKSMKCKSDLSKELMPFSNHYQMRKIKNELRANWNLKTYSYFTRGFYVSFKLNIEQLIFEAEKRRKSAQEKQYKNQEKEARIIALERLNASQP